MGYLDKVKHFLEQSSQSSDPVMPKSEYPGEPKSQVEAEEIAATASSIGDEVERVVALGARLKRGEISAVRCGVTGKRCSLCGLPCFGSEPWEDSK